MRKEMLVACLAVSGLVWQPFTGLAAESTPAKTESQDPPAQRTPGKDGEKNAAAKGVVIGVVIAKGKDWVQIKSVSGKQEKYIPEWVGGAPKDGGGPNKDVVKQIAGVNVGDKVSAEWYVNDHLRLKGIQVLERAKEGKAQEK